MRKRKPYVPTQKAEGVMLCVLRDVATAGVALGYGKNFQIYTPVPKYRKHADEYIAVLAPAETDLTNLTGQDSAFFVRYYRDGVRIIPFENTGPTRVMNYLRGRYPDTLVVAAKPFVRSYAKGFAKKEHLWTDIVPKDALNHC